MMTTDRLIKGSSSSSYLGVYDRFEVWLRENGASFEQLELREYNTDPNRDSFISLKDESGSNASSRSKSRRSGKLAYASEEKKESSSSYHKRSPLNVDDDDDNGEGSEMRGVHTKTSIPPNTVCMSIPKKCLITVEMGQQTDIGRQILSSDLDLDAPKHIFLMIYILQDRLDPNSFFRPYYDVLPKTMSNMPIFWSRYELSWLEGSYLLTQIEDRIEAIEDDYKSICEVCPQLSEIATLEEFKWARMCVCSRNFGLQIDGNRTSALVPHADMLNHYRPRETKWTFDDERQAFTITTLQTIHSGAQIYDSYGQKCNHRFLLNYGFAIENNVELDGFCPNEVPIELSILPSDPFFERKLDFWCREDSPALKRVRVCISNNENTKVLMSMLRVIVSDPREFDMICAAGSSGGVGVPSVGSSSSSSSLRCSGGGLGMLIYRTCRDIRFPLSLRNERAVLNHLLTVVRRALSKYPTTLAQDNERLAGEDLAQFSNARHAVIQVRGEKEVLHHYEDLALTALQVIDIDDDDQFDAAIKSMEGMGKHHIIHKYCGDVIGSTRREEKRRMGRSNLLKCNTINDRVGSNGVGVGRGGGGGTGKGGKGMK